MLPSAAAAIASPETRPTMIVSTTPIAIWPTCTATSGSARRRSARTSSRLGRNAERDMAGAGAYPPAPPAARGPRGLGLRVRDEPLDARALADEQEHVAGDDPVRRVRHLELARARRRRAGTVVAEHGDAEARAQFRLGERLADEPARRRPRMDVLRMGELEEVRRDRRDEVRRHAAAHLLLELQHARGADGAEHVGPVRARAAHHDDLH